MPSTRHIIHHEHHPGDPAFLRDERRFLDHERASLEVMVRHRDHLAADIERCRTLAERAGIQIDRSVAGRRGRTLALIGIGSQHRCDDAAGLEVARRLREAKPPGVTVLEESSEPSLLLEDWSGTDEALVVEAVSSDSRPGTVHRFEAGESPLPPELFRSPAHAAGIVEAVALGRKLGRLPGRLAVYGIEAESLEAGEGLTDAVHRSVDLLVAELYEELGGRRSRAG